MKIAIVGAGINGLYIANKLAQKGFDITVFEKKSKIGENVVCSGLFSSRILDYIPESEKLITSKINYADIHFPKKTIRLAFSRSFLVMDHGKLDEILFEKCQTFGVKFNLSMHLGVGLLSLLRSPTPKSDGLGGFDKIIGCDGAFSHVRKSITSKEPKYRIGINGYIKHKDNSDRVHTWPTKNGFIWKIPRGDRTEYGILENPTLAIGQFQKFLQENKINLPEIQSKIIPMGLVMPKDGKITLCGDAAGLTKPWSGGGVIWGFKAADMLVESFPDFEKYQRKSNLFFMRKIFVSKLAVSLAYNFGFHFPYIIPKNVKIESDYLL